ncbi:SpoIIE family protein phosphatase [Streptomyces sp. NPDC093225]|uniref:SpoIIE family protein phosphatase n=1 Tax=Streptomyces sp. NPDC093225 TaxID=3366034 RepID=UPI00381A9648
MGNDVGPPGDVAGPEVLALAKVVARLRSEVVDLEGVASMAAVLERAKGVVMAQEGVAADAAYELLRDRAEAGRRTLVEECWLTLGRAGPRSRTRAAVRPVAPEPAPSREPAEPSPFSARRYLLSADEGGGGEGDGARQALRARLAAGLTVARTPGDVAGLLRAVLVDTEHVDVVLVYTVSTAGSLELAGCAGLAADLAEQWSRIPPLAGIAPLEAAAEGQAVWLEDPEQDGAHYLPIGGPPERWPTRAWIPAPGVRPTTVVGLLRTRATPFDPRTRTLLRQAVRLCAGPLQQGGHATGDLGHEDVSGIQRIFDALSGPATLLTPLRNGDGEVEDYWIDAAAPESVDVAGRRGKELVGLRILETYPTVAGSALWAGYLDTLATGSVYEGEPFVYHEVLAGVPHESTYSVRASRLGERLVVSWVRHDTSEREARRLADMQRLGNLGWASWNLTTDTITWSEQVYAVFDRDPARGPMPLEELPLHLVPDDVPRLGAAVERLLGHGEPIDQPFRITTVDGVRHLRIVAEARADADGTPAEVHGFFQDLSAQRDAEIALRESERANLLQRGMLQAERALAARLQETLLPIPEQSLELGDLCVDVAYVPAESGVNVGGDWYSAIELPDGDALFVVGDVAGHGLAAVGTMAQLRFTAKGMAVTGSALPQVLTRLNALLLHTAPEGQGATATMVMARYRPADHRLFWVRAGHLPPLLVRGGRARFLPQPAGSLLGADRGAAYGEAVIDLEPGDHLLLYTDGLVEDPGEDIEDGLARLADQTLRLLREGRDDTLARTLAAQRPRHRDDICALDIHLPGPDDC